MALIVEGTMPTCCGMCCECLGGGSDAYYCNRAKRQISEVVPPYDKRMEWCPILGEIPDEYGRLIDADKLAKSLELWSYSAVDTYCTMTISNAIVKEILSQTPTVLEASK